jgi:N-glycosylase/DNA lyase
MNKVIDTVNRLRASEIKDIINTCMQEFSSFRNKPSNELFKELCFCLMTANFSAHGGIKIQNAINDGFLHLEEVQLARQLSELGHRFPNARARFVVLAREHKDNIKEILEKIGDEKAMRNWLADSIKGLGMKESSHFLRNIGYKNVAIIDFHIIDLLVREGLIDKPKSKSLTPKKYLEIESVLNKIAEETNLSLGELDLYLWYEETGKILK